MFNFGKAVLTLAGLIIGVGMFGIPFSFVRAGFWLGTLELVILAGVILLFHLLYGEIVLRTQNPHRLPGYVRIYLGPKARILVWPSSIFGISGTLLAYLVLGSTFLHNILRSLGVGTNEFTAALIIVFTGALITAFSLKKEAAVNGVFTILLVVLILALVIILLPGIKMEYFSGFNFADALLPYGVLLFALSGGVAIPDVVTLLGRDRRKTRMAIVIGSLLPAVIYFFWAAAVVGVSGLGTSMDAIAGLQPVLGDTVVGLGSIIGFLAVFTSYLTLSKNAQEMLRLDAGFSRFAGWLASILLPFALYTTGFNNFILIISLVGAVSVGVDASLMIASHHNMLLRGGIPVSLKSYFWKVLIYMTIAAGIVLEVKHLFAV